MRNIAILMLMVFTLSMPALSCAYDGKHHRELIYKAVEVSDLTDYMMTNLLMPNGIETRLIGHDDDRQIEWRVSEWFRVGGEREDDGLMGKWTILTTPGNLLTTRGFNHFHDPLKDWDEAGLPINRLGSQSFSSIAWGFAPKIQAEDEGLTNNTGDWSWDKAREYYYKSFITDPFSDPPSNPALSRETALAYCFRALGQSMHIVQDASVPDHTRNDVHMWGDYERYLNGSAKQYGKDHKIKRLETAIQVFYQPFSPIYPSDILLTEPNTTGYLKDGVYIDFPAVSGLIDRNIYTGVPGSGIPENSNELGLAEYTNANFFSNDTIFKYPHPSPEDVSYDVPDNWLLKQVTAEDGFVEYRLYLRKEFGESVDPVAAKSYLIEYYKGDLVDSPSVLLLDEECYKAYAQKLIPRAIGYSKKILDYFFRGELKIHAPDNYVYGIIDGANPVQQFTKIRAKVRNSTPEEEAGPGTIVAVARYRIRTNYENDMSTDPPTQDDRQTFDSYSVSAIRTIDTSLSSDNYEEFEFDFTNEPIPAGITDLYLFVVFKGTLGLEKDTAVAVGSVDLREPTHFCEFNAHDHAYLDQEIWTWDEIIGDDHPELKAKVDLNGNGIVCETNEPCLTPVNQNTWLSFFSPDDEEPTRYQVMWDRLPYGRYGRVIFLSDRDAVKIQIATDLTGDYRADTSVKGICQVKTYQESLGSGWISDPIDTFRGVNLHIWSANSEFYPTVEGINFAPWWEHPLENTIPYRTTHIFN